MRAGLIGWLADGVVDDTGAVLASGKVYFYLPDTTTLTNVYTDGTASLPVSNPLTLDAAGRGTAFANSIVRVVIRNAADTVTISDFNTGNAIPATMVIIDNDDVNGGAETTLDQWLSSTGLSYAEGSGATRRAISTWLQETEIKASDYAAVGNDSTDDTVKLQAIIDRALLADRTGSGTALTATILIPTGTWKINGVLTAAIASGIKQLNIRGHGPKRTIIKQYGTAVDTLHLNYTSSTSCRVLIEDLAITASTTTSGAAIRSTNGNRGTLRRVEVGLHRTGLDLAAETGWRLDDCEVVSTDGNSAAIGITCGANTKIRDCIITGSSSLGKGISIDGVSAKVSGCEVSGFLTGIDVNSARARITDCDVTVVAAGVGISVDAANVSISNPYIVGVASTDTGIDINAADCQVIGGIVTGAATGVDIAAIARTKIIGTSVASNTTNYTINASATDTRIVADSDGSTGGGDVNSVLTEATASSTTSVTPTFGAGAISFYQVVWSSHSAQTLTINATSTTGLRKGQVLVIQIVTNDGANLSVGPSTLAWNSQYIAGNDTGLANDSGRLNTSGDNAWIMFVWNGSSWVSTIAAGDMAL